MSKAICSAVAAGVLALAAPGVALAGHGHHHHHKGRAKAHHARVRFEHFGAATQASDTTTSSQGGPKEGTPLAQPSAGSDENAGTVVSFEKEVLTIRLGDGSTVSGKVTSGTEIECVKAPTATASQTGDDKGEDEGSGDKESSGEKEDQSQTEGSKEDSGDGEDSTTSSEEAPCGASALKEGVVVREAELKVSSSGSEFESIELVL